MQKALGEIKPNSTSVALRATNNQSVPAAVYPCEAIQFQALGANTGSVFICDRQSPTLTSHVHVEIPPPSSDPVTRPGWTVGNPTGANPLNAAEYWVLPEVSGEGVRVTVLES
jgi:hypothetical protein